MPPVRSTTTRLSPALASLAKTIRDLQDQVNRLERGQRTHQLDFYTVENGSIQTTDSTGTIRSVLGAQPDGTFAHALFNGPAPLAPDVPVVAVGINSLAITWDGLMSDGSAPLTDFAWVEIHINTAPNITPSSSDLAGHLYQAGSFVAPGLTAGTTYYVTLVAVNTSGAASPPSTYSAGTPTSVVGSIPAGAITPTQLGFQARSIGGITITVMPTPPANPQFGDIWFDGSNGNLANTWNGSAWVPYQWGTNSIQAGSITAQLIAAGTIIAGSVDGTTITGAKFVATGTSGEILAYNGVPAVGNLVLAVSPVAGSDSFGNSYFAGVTTYNGFGAVVNLLSTDHAAFFQYQNLGTSSQGSMILSVASASGSDPVTSATYQAGMFGVDPVFGDYMTTTGANISLGIGTVITRTGGVRIQAAAVNSANPYIKVDAPEQSNTNHMQMLLQGTSPDGTSPGQALVGLVSGSATLAPTSNAMMEVQDSTGDGGLDVLCSVATPAQAALGIFSKQSADRALSIRVTGDTNSRLRSDSNGKLEWGGGGAGAIDTNLYRGAANLLQTDDALALTNMGSAPVGTSGATKIYGSGGQPWWVNPAGQQMAIQGATLGALAVNTVTTATFGSLTTLGIAAGDANVIGATYKVRVWGYGTWGSTQQQLTFGIRFGATAATVVGVSPAIAAAALSASAAFQWSAELTYVLVTNPGLTTATWRVNIEGIIAETANPLNPGTANNSIPFSSGTGATDVTVDASIAESIGLSALWASTTGAPTISKSFAQLERTA